MPHQDLEGAPTSNELRLAYGLAHGTLHVEVVVCPSDGGYPFCVDLGPLAPTFSWYAMVKRPYTGAEFIDVYALPLHVTLDFADINEWGGHWLGDVVHGERSGRLLVCLSERPLHSRIHHLASIWGQYLEDQDVEALGYCPECARLLPRQVIDKELFLAEPCRLIDGRCPACGWT